jgi:hypothetical protein
MVSTCTTCSTKILTSSAGLWFDPVAAVNPVTAYRKAHRCTNGEAHTPLLSVNTQVAVRGRKTAVVSFDGTFEKEI